MGNSSAVPEGSSVLHPSFLIPCQRLCMKDWTEILRSSLSNSCSAPQSGIRNSGEPNTYSFFRGTEKCKNERVKIELLKLLLQGLFSQKRYNYRKWSLTELKESFLSFDIESANLVIESISCISAFGIETQEFMGRKTTCRYCAYKTDGTFQYYASFSYWPRVQM